MAWRDYVDPTTGQWWSTDDAGNFEPGDLQTSQRGIGHTEYPSLAAPTIVPSGDLGDITQRLRAAGYNGPWDAASQQAAFARTVGGGNAGGRPTLSGTPGGTTADMLNAAFRTNEMDAVELKRQFDLKFEEDKRRYGLDYAEQQRATDLGQVFNLLGLQQKDQQYYTKLGEEQRQFDVNTGVGMAQTNATLRGPANYAQYVKNITGGRNAFDAVASGQPSPAFGQPTGYTPAASYDTLLADMQAIRSGAPPRAPAPGNTAPPPAPPQTFQTLMQQLFQTRTPGGGTAPGVDANTALDWIWGHWGGLQDMARNNGVNVGDMAAVRTWLTTNWLPNNAAGKTPAQVAIDLGMPAASTPAVRPTNAAEAAIAPVMPAQDRATTQPYPAAGTTPGYTPPSAADNYGLGMGVLPYQMNPMVWNSLGPTAKALYLSSVEAGNTPAGAYEIPDYLAQYQASLPKGNAPQSTQFSWAKPNQLF